MPNDTLDEIEARWKDAEPYWYQKKNPIADIRTLIEMVRARDRKLDITTKALRQILHADEVDTAAARAAQVLDKLAALDTPPAQEPTE